MADYRIFRPTYTHNGAQHESRTYHVEFRDHLRRRQTIAGGTRATDAHKLAGRVMELVECRRHASAPGDRLQRWLDALPLKTRDRLIGMELMTVQAMELDKPLAQHLDGVTDAAGNVTAPGYKQSLEAHGATADSISPIVFRVGRLLRECGFTFWPDLHKPGAPDSVSVFLGKLREAGDIGGTTLNYYVRDLRSFCRWLAQRIGAAIIPMAGLTGVENAESDAQDRRALSVDEMRGLCASTVDGPPRYGVGGEDRAILYRFAFESGIRPGQIRALTVGNFALNAEPPTVTTQARYVKRRRQHAQVLTAGMAADLRERFASRMPAALAFKMPSKSHLAEMIRADLAAARTAWIANPFPPPPNPLQNKLFSTRPPKSCATLAQNPSPTAYCRTLLTPGRISAPTCGR